MNIHAAFARARRRLSSRLADLVQHSIPTGTRIEPLETRIALAVLNVSGTIANGTVWASGDIQHIVGDVTLPAGATLTIQPGAIIKFDVFAGLDIAFNGNVNAAGTSGQPIIFTSWRDDTAGGDTNADGAGSLPNNSDWNNITFGSTSTSSLSHVQVRYGGAGSLGEVIIASSNVSFTDSIFRNSSTAGVRINASNPTLTGSTFSNNSVSAVSMDLASNPTITGVTMSNNVINGLNLDGGTLTGSRSWNDPDIVYRLTGDVTVAAGATLTVGAGQIVKVPAFAGIDLLVSGTLHADGTAGQRIIFTSERDDTAGGDTNNDSNGNLPNNGNWNGITFNSGSTNNVMDNVEVRYAGATGIAAVAVNSAVLSLTNSTIHHSSQAGLRIIGSDPTLTNNVFHTNSSAAISMDLASNPAISGVTLTNNVINGLNIDGGMLTGARFWDDPDIVYRLTGDVTVAAGATLTLGAGQIVKVPAFAGFDLIVNGTLQADGTPGQRIIFTSERDDTVGGDTNNDGIGSLANSGNWNSITFGSGSTGSVMDNVEVRFAGGTGIAAVAVNNAALSLTNSTIGNSSTDGLRIVGSNPTVTTVTFINNNFAAVSMDLASNPTISGVTLTNNVINALNVDGGTLTGSQFWDDSDIVYRITGDVTVAAGATLTIAPGQIVKVPTFAGFDLIVNGTLLADGTAAQRIIFTSDRDDSAGGDTNNDTTSSQPNNSNWNSITFNSGSTGNVMDNVEVRYSGATGIAAVAVNSAALSLTNSTIRHSGSNGLRIVGSNPTVTALTFTHNSSAAVSMDLTSNPAISGVTMSNNIINGLNIDGGTLTGSRFWDDPDIVYRPIGTITVAAGATLTIAPGQIVKVPTFTSIDLIVNGTLIADGTAAQRIVFTSDRDDTAGGDTNNDANGNLPNNGNWRAISFGSGSTGNVMDHVEVRYGGASGAAVFLNTAELTLTNSILRHSSNHGLRIAGSNPVLTTNSFLSNTGAAISMDLASDPDIDGVTLASNGANALILDAGAITTSRAWNDPDIPYRLTGDVTVNAGVTLTIAPGQVVKGRTFTGDDLIINGTLLADGTAAAPIIFTSDRDDTAGGDTNNDGNGNLPNNGNWNGIIFNAGSTGNVLDHAEVRYGGNAILVTGAGASATITNSIIRHSSSHAFLVRTGASLIASNNLIFKNNDTGLRAESGATVTAFNLTIDGNFRGIAADGSGTSLAITNSIVSNNSNAGAVLSAGATITASFNDFFNTTNFSGLASQTGTNGNISANPNFFNRANSQFGLRAGSPAVDTGTSTGAPTTDLFGNARFDDPNVLNLGGGTPAFFDMGAIERQEVSLSDIDLRALTVSGPATGLQGQTVTINWTVENLGPAAVLGAWFDAVYLSIDDVFSPDDIFLGDALHTGDLAPGASYANSKQVTLPGVLPDDYRLIVRANSRGEVFEGIALLNNSVASTSVIAMDLPVLAVGAPVNGTLPATGSALFYKINAPAGADLSVLLDGPNSGFTNELYVSFGELPSRQSFDERGNRPNLADQSISVPDTQAGQYYAMVFGANLSGSENFTISASIAGFGITSISPARGSNTGTVTISITGSQFDANSQPRLIDSAGGTVLPTEVFFTDSGHLAATFDLTGRPAGAADVQVVNTGNNTTTLPDALNVVAGTAGKLVTSITSSGQVRLGRDFIAYLEYTNTGDTDLIAPIVRVLTGGQTQLSLDPNRVGLSDDLELIAINPNGPAGVLPPGATGRIPIYGRAVANGDDVLRVEVASYPNTPIDYDALESSIRPPDVTNAEWTPLFNQLKTQLGTTWTSYLAQLSRNASLLPPSLGENTSPQDAFQLEVLEARAALATSVSGKLFLGDNTRTLADATIVFEGRNTGDVFVGTSLNDGSFLIPRLTADTYDVRIEGFDLGTPVEVTIASADVNNVNVTASPGATLSGGVLLATTGQPLPNQLVVAISATGAIFTTRTDGTGLYVFTGLPAGTYDLRTGEGQFVEKTLEDVIVAAGAKKLNVNLPLTLGGTISGTILAPGGAPLSGATVIAYDANGFPVGDAAISNASGAYVLSGVPSGAVTILVTTSNFAPAREANVNVSAGATTGGHNFSLVAGGTLTGTVRDQGSAPIDNTVVFVESGGVVIASVQAEADGSYRFDHLAPGSYTVTATLPGYFGSSTNTTITNGQTTNLSPFTLGTAGSVSGTLTFPGGAALGGVHVTAWLNDERVAGAVTKADGTYLITGLDLGSYLITVGSEGSSAGNSTTVLLNSGTPTATVNLSLPIIGSVQGRVFDINGTTPLGGVSVTLLLGADSVAATTSDAQGNYIFNVLVPGTYAVQAFADGKAFAPDTNLVIASNTNLDDVDIIAGAAVAQGTLTNAGNGQPLANARLFITGSTIDGVMEIQTNASGQYSFTGPAGAMFEIVARPDGLAYAVQNVTLSGGGPVTANFSLGAGASISGAVRDGSNGAPLGGALIQFRQIGGPADGPIAITNAAGQYAINGLPAGNYDIVVVADGEQSFVVTSIAIATGANARDFNLEDTSTSISGTVRDTGNKPLAGARIQAIDSRGNTVGWTEAGDDGVYTLTSLPAGTFTLTVETAGTQAIVSSPTVLTTGSNLQNVNFSLTTVAIHAVIPSQLILPEGSIFAKDPPNRLPDEAVLPALQPGENCVRVIEAHREAEARIRNRDLLFEAWSENVAAGNDLKDANAKLLTAQFAVFAGNLAKIGLKFSGLRTEITQAGRLAGLGDLNDTQAFVKNFSDGVGLADTYILKGRDLINGIGDALINGQQLSGLADIVGQLTGILGAVRDLTTRIIGEGAPGSAWGKANPLFDIFLDVVGFVKDTIDGGLDLCAAVRDINTVNGNTDVARDLYIKAEVAAEFAVDRYTFELNHCEEHDPKVKSPADVPLPGFLGGPTAGGSSTPVAVRSSFDPNDKHGPAGFDNPATVGVNDGFIRPQAMPFEVEFENIGQIAAQIVRVTDTLDADLDLTTFEFTGFGFSGRTFTVDEGLNHYETELDLRIDGIDLLVTVVLDLNTTTREVTVTFSTFDPITMLAPEGFEGFLPKNNADGMPGTADDHEGEGYFTYIVSPKTGLTTGTTITNQANIFFDDNAPILTPSTLNTIDVTAPTSAVNALSANTDARTFEVSWLGNDGAGSGATTFDVYVSDNGGAFVPFLTNTTQISAMFTGERGHTYGFYSVAADGVGLVETQAAVADTTILINPPVLIPVVKKAVFTDSDGDTYTVSFSGPGTLNVIQIDPDQDNRGPIEALIADSTTNKSKITVTVKKNKLTGDGIVTIGEVMVTGGLASFTAKASDLTVGGFTATGPVKTISIRDLLQTDVNTDPQIVIGGTNVDKLGVTARNIADGFTLTTPGILNSLVAADIGSGNIDAISIGKIQTKAGAFDADVTATGAVNSITVKGGGLSGQLVAQRFGPISITGGNFSGEITSTTPVATLGKLAALSSLKISQGDLAGDIRLLGPLGAVTISAKATQPGGNVTDATINASKIASLVVAKNVSNSIILAGADLGADHAFGGGDDLFAAGSINKVQIGGAATGVVIGAGFSTTDATLKNNDDDILGGTTSVIASLLVKGNADAASYFAAGLFKKAPKIANVAVVPANDNRFLVG